MSEPPPNETRPDHGMPADADINLQPPVADDEETVAEADAPIVINAAQMHADVSEQWSWASSAARIPQISDLVIDLAEPVERAKITVTVTDGDLQFGAKVAHEGALEEGRRSFGDVHVPLSAAAMSGVDERRGAECRILLEDQTTERVLALVAQSIDIQPRDFWLSLGDPRGRQQHERLVQQWEDLATARESATGPDVEAIEAQLDRIHAELAEKRVQRSLLSRSLLASFVRPNHPEIALVAREAAEYLRSRTGNPSFFAFQITDVAQAEERADESVNAVYEALQNRAIAYSEPPPGWDYRGEGQRIRDHGDVAAGGLGTCMDTTVLLAAVIEHVGLHPVLVLVEGHIFVGYWRRDPVPEQQSRPEWYPDTPLLEDLATIASLIDGGWLDVIETTTFTVGGTSPENARAVAKESVREALARNDIALIDVVAARSEGVSPLPAIRQKDDGVLEIVEYRPGGVAPAVIQVERPPIEPGDERRRTDTHPARYRTWKASLFSLNATNDLLALKKTAKVQPLAVPPSGLGRLEDLLNQDHTISLLNGDAIPDLWKRRGVRHAGDMLASTDPANRQDLLSHLEDRKVYVQRIGRDGAAYVQKTFVKELGSMAHAAKTARDEEGVNPLYLCLGILRWKHEKKRDVHFDAPLILVPVDLAVARRRQEFTLSLDSSQQTTPNAALIEWLRQEHNLSIPDLAEPLLDRNGIDVDAVLTAARNAVAERGLDIPIIAEARLALLNLSAFRMWKDLDLHAETFLARPLVKHLVEAPTEQFEDAAIGAADEVSEQVQDELEALETPVPADSTQKQAVLWARQGRTFVLQGPPGTGKSQTITNMVAECVMEGLKVLFVAEKGTALSVVQRRLEEVGLGPFTLNLHHEAAAQVREQLKRALTATVAPDSAAMESARRRLRSARFELTQYPQQLHETNAAGLSAYSAQDELLVLGDGPTIPLPPHMVAREADSIAALRELFHDLQPWTAAAGVRPDHPWRLAGSGSGDPFDVAVVSQAVRHILEGTEWTETTTGDLRGALNDAVHPDELHALAAAANPVLPAGDELADILDAKWPDLATRAITDCETSIRDAAAKLHGFSPVDLAGLDVGTIAAAFREATESGFLGRRKRQVGALRPLQDMAPPGLSLQDGDAGTILDDLIAAQDAGRSVVEVLQGVPGLRSSALADPFEPEAFQPARDRLDSLLDATASLRDDATSKDRALSLARTGLLSPHVLALRSYADGWDQLWESLNISEHDFETWRGERMLIEATRSVAEQWRRELDHERLLPLQRWCALVRKIEPLAAAGLTEIRDELLAGDLRADVAEDALARGIARASLEERMAAAGLNRFNAVAHDERVTSYSQAQGEVRTHWTTVAPATLLERRGAGGKGENTGGLARELEKTTKRLSTRPILRRYATAVQELTPVVLCSPSSVVDLIDPEAMEFDVVIFDEASQITVPEAVGSLGRARAAIVVGDTKQMPPTRKVGGGGIDDDLLDDPDAEEIVEDQESILSECELARVPTLSLSWHYRSQDEALIAFSNTAYYGGDLSSFPTPTLRSSETGVEFRRVYDPERGDRGMYIRAGSSRKVKLSNGDTAGTNTNPFEAERIVEYIHQLVDASDELPSVGIVTFNEQQRALIKTLLDAHSDPRIKEITDHKKMGQSKYLFVKALEQVQGDERDVIIFSIAFSKQDNGKIPTNFGPLTNYGGERRLNVAVTRARRKNVVFCSFDPSDLDASKAMYKGPRDLEEFLHFAQRAGAPEETSGGLNHIAIRDRHRDTVAQALKDAGLHVRTDVGLSNFRLDLVLARPENPDRPILPVLLDGESWRNRTTVTDRDVLPVEVLTNLMGWPMVARIWWPMWLQNRQEVIQAIQTELDRAETILDAAGTTTQQLSEEAGEARAEPVHPAAAVPADETDPDAPTVAEPTVTAVPVLETELTPARPIVPADASSHQDDENGAPIPRPAVDDPMPAELEPIPTDAEIPVDVVSETEPEPATPATTDAPHPTSETNGNEPSGMDIESAPDLQADVQAARPFVAAHTDVVGSRDTLDQLPERSAAGTVKQQLLEVIEAEGPIEITRLVRIVGRRFNLNAVRQSRADAIAKLIPRAQLRRRRAFGSFAWPMELNPETWTGYRTSDAQDDRPLDEIAPEEIANAMRIPMRGTSDMDQILRETAEVFGISRLGANVRRRLEGVYGSLRDADDGSV